ncbi:PLDc N-terminal domain-containing protein [Naasia lichenicola]|uniref:Cardiolipin synthase N-terminal domain-containing protein n=1 Tax=Naasia lichenicola TaxID=2565933 RepID=A0A4S4FKT1_9MICO|nr:PLDc N-terminal domain-containing protein [Naasia lichenicola]THG31053.1 hypothetical protein E6C64_10715 [Naasia lichenicola]
MPRFWLIFIVVAVAFTVYSLVDCAMADRTRIRGPRKPIWFLIILLLPVLGGVLWFLIGRGRRATATGRPRTIAPDDDPAFLRTIALNADEEARLQRLEQELADLDGDAEGEGGDAPGRRDA